MTNRLSIWENDELEKSLSILNHWSICAMPQGMLTIAPRGSRIRLIDFCLLVNRMICNLNNDASRTILFCFEHRQVQSSAWPIFVRLVEALARKTGGKCMIVRALTDGLSSHSEFAPHRSYLAEECERPAAWFPWYPSAGTA